MRVVSTLCACSLLALQRSASGVLQRSASGSQLRDSLPVEEIDLDLPPFERWRDFVTRHRKDIIGKVDNMGRLYEAALGPKMVARWLKAAHVPAELEEEYRGIERYVNDSGVTYSRLVITDMWQAVDAPSFGCSGVLAAMPNGTVVHGRNIDYEQDKLIKVSLKHNVTIGGGGGFFDGVFKKGGRRVAEFIASTGSLGIHTGMAPGRFSINSNARGGADMDFFNGVAENLKAAEAGAENFPWVMRRILLSAPDFKSALSAIEGANLNAPNYFILAGSEPYQGAVVTKDRMGTHEATTPPTQRLNASAGVWHLVQTNDDLLSDPLDARRGSALLRLSQSDQASVSLDFVEGEMRASPTTNSDTLLTWVADPKMGAHRVFTRPASEVLKGLATKMMHKAMHIPMPQDLPETSASVHAAATHLRGTGSDRSAHLSLE